MGLLDINNKHFYDKITNKLQRVFLAINHSTNKYFYKKNAALKNNQISQMTTQNISM